MKAMEREEVSSRECFFSVNSKITIFEQLYILGKVFADITHLVFMRHIFFLFCR